MSSQLRTHFSIWHLRRQSNALLGWSWKEKCDHKIVKWENLKVFAITKVTHARIYVYVDERKNTTTMSHRNENFYKFLEDVRENANMLKPYYDEKNSFEKKSVSITRAYWRKKSREWKWLRVTAAYCKKNLLSISFETIFIYFLNGELIIFYRGTFQPEKPCNSS